METLDTFEQAEDDIGVVAESIRAKHSMSVQDLVLVLLRVAHAYVEAADELEDYDDPDYDDRLAADDARAF